MDAPCTALGKDPEPSSESGRGIWTLPALFSSHFPPQHIVGRLLTAYFGEALGAQGDKKGKSTAQNQNG